MGLPLHALVLCYFIWTQEEENNLHILRYLGLLLIVLCLNAFIHVITIPNGYQWVSKDLLDAGGYAGVVLGVPLVMVMGKIASITVLLALGIIAILLILNTSLRQLGRKTFSWVKMPQLDFLNNTEKQEEEEYEDEDTEDEDEATEEEEEDAKKMTRQHIPLKKT